VGRRVAAERTRKDHRDHKDHREKKRRNTAACFTALPRITRAPPLHCLTASQLHFFKNHAHLPNPISAKAQANSQADSAAAPVAQIRVLFVAPAPAEPTVATWAFDGDIEDPVSGLAGLTIGGHLVGAG
jgi:hypothetical protein